MLEILSSRTRCPRFSAWLQIVARDQPGSAIAVVDLSLPPSIILVAEDCQKIPLGECQFCRNGSLVHVKSTSWYIKGQLESRSKFRIPTYQSV